MKDEVIDAVGSRYAATASNTLRQTVSKTPNYLKPKA